MTYISVEQMLAGPTGWLTVQTGVRSGTRVPSDLIEIINDGGQYIQIRPYAGSDRTITLDEVALDVNVFSGPDESDPAITADVAALNLAERVRWLMRTGLAGYVASGGVVSRVETIQRPCPRDWDDDQDIGRYQAAYRVTIHSS